MCEDLISNMVPYAMALGLHKHETQGCQHKREYVSCFYLYKSLTLQERPDILPYALQASHFPTNSISDTIQMYKTHKPPDEDIRQCALQATFVDECNAHVVNSVNDMTS